MSIYFPKRLELSFFKVLAFPKAWNLKTKQGRNCVLKKLHRILHSRSFTTHIQDTDLKHGIGKKQSVTDIVEDFGTWTADSIELKDFLWGLCFSGPTLPWDEDEVVVELRHHCAEGIVCQRITESTARGQRPTKSHFFTFKMRQSIKSKSSLKLSYNAFVIVSIFTVILLTWYFYQLHVNSAQDFILPYLYLLITRKCNNWGWFSHIVSHINVLQSSSSVFWGPSMSIR